ncbi:MAG: GTP-binding protein [Proteobacteria bacterium]|nr:GTP-binding protein [Pseudomonadota bacterium]MCL2308149.1 GTP-binding protein [Pseudomonadota bacterium]
MVQEYKLLFAGGMGVGKTTAISAVSEIPPVSTDVANSDREAFDKELTTVTLDYGRITLPSGDRLRLYGIPGQQRFSFMWAMLEHGAMGMVLLADASRPDPFAELDIFLKSFHKLLRSGRAVLGVGRLSKRRGALDKYVAKLARRKIKIPVFSVDVRKKKDVLLLLDALFTQIEVLEDDYRGGEPAEKAAQSASSAHDPAGGLADSNAPAEGGKPSEKTNRGVFPVSDKEPAKDSEPSQTTQSANETTV